MMKKVICAAGALAVLADGSALWALVSANATGRSSVADAQVALADFAPAAEPAAIARGEVVMRAGDCLACHTTGAGSFAGGYEIPTPFGKLVSSNITPDRDTGIGKMTERDFFDAVRHGQGSKGFLYPAMPYTAYAKLTDADMHDLWAYMSTVPPVANRIDENAGMSFPYNIRLAMAGWNMLFFDNAAFAPDPSRSEIWNRGRYLVEGPGHCASCHSPRNGLGATIVSEDLHGGQVGTWVAPPLAGTPHGAGAEARITGIAAYLKTGSDGMAVASGPMAEVVEMSTQFMPMTDLTAMATYLQSLNAPPKASVAALAASDPAMMRGALHYEVSCSACHGVRGEGVPEMITTFAGNPALLADNTATLTSVVLGGTRAAHTESNPTAAGMPAFDWKMSDQDIADTLTYLRNAWGNAARPVRTDEVSAMRSRLGLPMQMTYPAPD